MKAGGAVLALIFALGQLFALVWSVLPPQAQARLLVKLAAILRELSAVIMQLAGAYEEWAFRVSAPDSPYPPGVGESGTVP